VICVARADVPTLCFSLGGLSKSAGLPQLKLGWIVLGGPSDGSSHEAAERLEIIADSYLSVATPVQLGAARLLDAGARVRAAILARVRENRAWLAARTSMLLPAEAGWTAILRLPAVRPWDDNDEELALALLRDHDTLVQPGYFFDMPRGTYVVVSLITPPAIFQKGCERLLSIAS
jgi:aspartate/methionine/tyrosine aminotransferase